MTVLCAVDDIRSGTASGLVTLDEHTIIGSIGDVDILEVPVAAGMANTLIGVVRVSMIGHSREVEHCLAILAEEFNGLVGLTIAVVDIDALVVDIRSCLHPDAVARLCNIDGLLHIEEGTLLRAVSSSVVAIGRAPDFVAQNFIGGIGNVFR